jgi:hypothetical protein
MSAIVVYNSDEEMLRRYRLRMTPERRNVAVVVYDREFARRQMERDPLFRALVSLHNELTRPYRDVPQGLRELHGRHSAIANRKS